MHFSINTLSAPGSYDVEKSEKKVIQSSSAYSFGIKYKDQRIDDIPGTILHKLNISLLLS